LGIITACTMDCPDACSLIVSKSPEGSIKIRGNPKHPFTSGFTCKKIRRHGERLQSPERILTPLWRNNKHWETITWQDALELCATNIQRFRQEPTSILHIQGDGARGVLKYANKLFFMQLGASRTRGSLCDAAGFMAFIHDFGSRENHDINDLLNAKTIVNWGKDLSRSSIHLAATVRKAKKNGTKAILISPGDDKPDTFSDQHIQIRPGTDRFLAAAVILRFIRKNNISERILDRTKHWGKFKSLISLYDEKSLIDQCMVPKQSVDILYEAYCKNSPCATIVATGLQRYRYGGENVRFINALALISDQIGRAGGGCYYHLHSMRNFNLQWVDDTESTPRRLFRKPLIGREIIEAKAPPIKMLWVNGCNIVNQAPNTTETIRAFHSVDFKVVVDAFMTDTAEQADLILPPALMLEQEDVIGSFGHDYIHYIAKIVEPPGEAKSDYWILTELGKRLDPAISLPNPETCFKKSLDSEYLSTSLEELIEKGFIRANHPKISYEKMRFKHPDGKARFPIQLHHEPDPPQDYPLRLLTLVRRDAIHSQMLGKWQIMPPTIWMAEESPYLKRINKEKNIYLVSPLGRLKVNLETSSHLHPEMVLYRRGDWTKLGGGANQLIQSDITDIGSCAPYYQQYVRVENG